MCSIKKYNNLLKFSGSLPVKTTGEFFWAPYRGIGKIFGDPKSGEDAMNNFNKYAEHLKSDIRFTQEEGEFIFNIWIRRNAPYDDLSEFSTKLFEGLLSYDYPGEPFGKSDEIDGYETWQINLKQYNKCHKQTNR